MVRRRAKSRLIECVLCLYYENGGEEMIMNLEGA